MSENLQDLSDRLLILSGKPLPYHGLFQNLVASGTMGEVVHV